MEPIRYFTMDGCQGEYFGCSRLSATLNRDSCASMWRQANSSGQVTTRHEKCKGCLIGALHAGESSEISTSMLMGKRICARCHKLSRRFVQNDICVSCYNRQREWLRGRNARGTKPIKQKPLHPVSVPYMAGNEVHVPKAALSESTVEMITRILRDSRKEVTFGFFKRALANGIGEMVGD